MIPHVVLKNKHHPQQYQYVLLWRVMEYMTKYMLSFKIKRDSEDGKIVPYNNGTQCFNFFRFILLFLFIYIYCSCLRGDSGRNGTEWDVTAQNYQILQVETGGLLQHLPGHQPYLTKSLSNKYST